MHDFINDPRFAGIEKFKSKVWWCLYNRTEIKKMPTASGFLEFSAHGKTFEKLSESLRESDERRWDWLLDGSWIDPFSKSANLNKEAEATLTDRRGLFALRKISTSEIACQDR